MYISSFPDIGHKHQQISADFRVCNFDKHIIIYKSIEDQNTLYIVRIMHQKANLGELFQ